MKPAHDPAQVFRNGRREAIFASVAWLLAMLWTVGYCFLFGYQHKEDSWPVQYGFVEVWQPEHFYQILGLPGWVMFGIVVPWLFWSAVTILFALFGIAEDDLGAEPASEGDAHGH